MNNPYQYMNMYQAPQMQPVRQSGNTLNWVQGREGAKALQINPNSNVLMLDSENDGIFYIKVSDNVGMCNMRTFRYEEITDEAQNPTVDLSAYVRKDELKELLKSFITTEAQNEQTVPANANTTSGQKPLIKL